MAGSLLGLAGAFYIFKYSLLNEIVHVSLNFTIHSGIIKIV